MPQLNVFKSGAELQAHLEAAKNPQRRELTVSFDIPALYKSRYKDHGYPDRDIINTLINGGAPIIWKGGQPPTDRDAEPEDFQFTGQWDCKIEHHTLTITLSW